MVFYLQVSQSRTEMPKTVYAAFKRRLNLSIMDMRSTVLWRASSSSVEPVSTNPPTNINSQDFQSMHVYTNPSVGGMKSGFSDIDVW